MTDTTTDDSILDANFIPVSPGVRFAATMPNPDYSTEFVTLDDGTLMKIGDRSCHVITRRQFVSSGHHAESMVNAVRERVKRFFPTRSQARMLPRSVQCPLLDAVLDHLDTADSMSRRDDDECVRDGSDRYGHAQWQITRPGRDAQTVAGFDLWNTGWMPVWDGPEPKWEPSEQ